MIRFAGSIVAAIGRTVDCCPCIGWQAACESAPDAALDSPTNQERPMTLFIVGLIVFLGIHSVAIVAPAWRDAQVARSEGAWKGIYSLVSIASFVLLIYG